MQPEQLTRAIGENVRKRRVERDMTQVELAEAIGVAQSYVSALEAGKLSPRVATMAKLAEALDMLPSQLLDVMPVSAG